MKKFKNGGIIPPGDTAKTTSRCKNLLDIVSHSCISKSSSVLAAPLRQGESWICRSCGEEYINPLAHSCFSIQPVCECGELIPFDISANHSCGLAPVLDGIAAEEFLKTIEQNKNKKVPKKEYDRAKENYKKFKVI